MNLNSVPVTRLLGIASLVIVLLAGWLLFIGPTMSRLGEVDDRMTDAEDRNSYMSLQLAQLRAQAEELPATRREADRLAQVFPPTTDQPGFFAQVTDAADKAGIGAAQITDISHGATVVPGAAEAGTPEAGSADSLPKTPADASIALQPVTVTVTGSYRELTDLVANLETMKRTLFVTGVDLSEGGDTEGAGKGSMTISVTGITFIAEPLDAPKVNQPAAARGAGEAGGTDQASG